MSRDESPLVVSWESRFLYHVLKPLLVLCHVLTSVLVFCVVPIFPVMLYLVISSRVIPCRVM